MPKMFVKELAELVKLTPRRIYQINEELPDDKKLIVREGGEKKADLALFVQRWAEYQSSLVRSASTMTLDEAKTMHEIIKTQKTRIEVKRLEGELIPASDVVAMNQEIVTNARNNLLHIPMTLAPEIIQAENAGEAERLMLEAIRSALEGLALMENYEPENYDPGRLEDEEEEADREWENS